MNRPLKKPDFAWVTLEQARAAGFEDLLAQNYEEVEGHQDVSPLDPDWPAYRDLERRGQLKFAVVRRGRRLIGYSVFFLHTTLHNRSTVWAINDVIYVDPAERRGGAGLLLIRQAEIDLKAMGARVVLYGIKAEPDLSHGSRRASVGRVLSRMGYRSFDQSWSKAL